MPPGPAAGAGVAPSDEHSHTVHSKADSCRGQASLAVSKALQGWRTSQASTSATGAQAASVPWHPCAAQEILKLCVDRTTPGACAGELLAKTRQKPSHPTPWHPLVEAGPTCSARLILLRESRMTLSSLLKRLISWASMVFMLSSYLTGYLRCTTSMSKLGGSLARHCATMPAEHNPCCAASRWAQHSHI